MLSAEDIVHFAPVGTAVVATVAGLIAYFSLRAQKEIARKRAAVDFFLKADLDSSILAVNQKFFPSIRAVNALIDAGLAIEDIEKTEAYKSVEAYLNIHELLAVAVRKSIFDERTCFDYWSGALMGHWEEAERLVTRIRARPSDKEAYIEVSRLYSHWAKRDGGRNGIQRSSGLTS
jgi:hypothetical protein